jgi:hypothetical protein
VLEPALVVNHPPVLVVPAVKPTAPPVLVTINCCGAGVVPPI